MLGLVINKISRREAGAYVYERGYYYSSDAGDEGTLKKPSDPTTDAGVTLVGPQAGPTADAQKSPAASSARV